MDRLQNKDQVETLIRSLSRFSKQTMLILSGQSDVSANSVTIGPALIFERLWEETGIKRAIKRLLVDRKFGFDVERAIFLTVLHRLMVSGSDRSCARWCRDYRIEGVEDLSLHHLYRAMGFLGEELEDQTGSTPFAPRYIKDRVEELLFNARRDLFSELEMVFFDTTSLYFEGEGGTIGKRGFSKDHRPDLKQMVVGAVIDHKGYPICCEMWPGNTADVGTLVSVAERMRKRFGIRRFCVVADRGMVSKKSIEELEERGISYILGVRMRLVKEVKAEVLSRGGRYAEVNPGAGSSPLKVKEVVHKGKRYIVCVNPKQARKDASDREAMVEALREQLKRGAKSLVGNKGYRKYLKVARGSVSIDMEKVKRESRFDGKWVLITNTDLSAKEVALRYKELWQVERVFREMKALLETRPIFHQRDENIRGHVFCSFLALVLHKELERRLENAGHHFGWSEVKQDLEALKEVTIEENGKRFAIRTQCLGGCGKVFKAVGIALPPTIREV